MVEDPRAKTNPGPIRPLGLPQPLDVRAEPTGRPIAVRIGRRWLAAQVLDRWRIDDEWWRREPLSRAYFAVLLSNGHQLTLFQDLVTSRWFRQHHG